MLELKGEDIKAFKDLSRWDKADLLPYEKEVILFLEEWFSEKDTIITKTSGSTGKPKEIRLRKEAMRASAQQTLSYFGLRKGQTALLSLPMYSIAGKMMVVRSLEGELNLLVEPPSVLPLQNINEKIDFAAMTPMQVQNILDNTPEKLDLVKILIIGGAPVSRELEEQLRSCKVEAFSTFGMTETISHVAVRALNKQAYFEGLKGVKFTVGDKSELIITAPYLSSDPIVTNDVVKLISSAKFIWKGRLDNVINTGGIKVQIEEIERKIEPFFKDVRYYVTSKKDKALGEKVVLVVERSGVKDEEYIKNMGFSMLPKYQRPKEVVLVDAFEETPTGKVIRKRFEDLFG